MAILAGIGSQYMCRVLAASDNSIVAADTIASDAFMFECSTRPGVGPVAVIAHITALDVTGILALRGDTIMATLAGTEDSKVVYPHDRSPGNRPMASITVRGHADMLT